MNNRSTLYQLIALVLPALVLIACGDGAQQETVEETREAAASPNKIIGTWDADVRAMMVASISAGRWADTAQNGRNAERGVHDRGI